MSKLVSAIAAILVLGCSANACADVIAFDNMPGDIFNQSVGGASYGPGFFGTGSPATLQGMQFTPSTTGYLTSVFAPMTIFTGSQSTVTLSLWSDGGDVPLSVIETSSRLVAPVTGAAILEWTWTATSLLEQGTNYWLVAQTDAPRTSVSWQYVPGYAVRANLNADEDWLIFFGNGGNTGMRLLVAPVAVPAPTTLPLLLLGALALRWSRRRKS